MNNIIKSINNFLTSSFEDNNFEGTGFDLLKSAVGRRLCLYRNAIEDVKYDFDSNEILFLKLDVVITEAGIKDGNKINDEDFIKSLVGELIKTLEFITKKCISSYFLSKLERI